MALPNAKQRSVDATRFAMIPRAEIPRSTFDVQTTHKTTFDAGYLIPIYEDEVLPGDAFSLKLHAFARLATPLYPVMDNLHLETFFFFVPNRLIWNNWVKMMGEQDNPADSISYTTPQQVSPAGGYAVGSLQDYFGLPTVGQVAGGATVSHNALPLRAHNLIWNTWFRDENLQNSLTVDKGDGPDTVANYTLQRRGKRKDYFTSALPWPQKGATSVSLPLGTSATVKTNATNLFTGSGNPALKFLTTATGAGPGSTNMLGVTVTSGDTFVSTTAATSAGSLYPSNLYADLSTATAATINQLRQSFQIQRLLERDARGGTRYQEIVNSHFGVNAPLPLYRPEYLGGGSAPIIVQPVSQNTQTGVTGGATPLGTLAGVGAASINGHGFTKSFTEHGIIIGLANVRADLTYQQGLRKMWSRGTRYDYYFPAFAMLGEQAILNKEIYCDGSANDANVFGYQERWSELRYHPSKITGLFRSTSAGTVDPWHLAQRFTGLPTLNTTFIQDTPPLSRVLAVGASANGQQIIFDSFFSIRKTRPLPMFSVPGMIDHF